ncbi:MAG: strictosidine synthase [Caldimonas sp.]
MTFALREWKDRVLGRGDASITVPVFDGALKSNNLLEQASTFAALDAPEDLASDGRSLFVADGGTVLRYDLAGDGARGQAGGSAAATLAHGGTQSVTALACLTGGGLAIALDGREVRIVGGAHDGRRWDTAGGAKMNAVNAIGVAPDERLLVTDGSLEHPVAHWRHDLMGLGRSGRLFELNLASGEARVLATGLAYAFGACAAGPETWVSESWSHRVRAYVGAKRGRAVTDSLPGYPSRISPAAGGGFWLTCFALRTQLVEFVLREHAYRKRMLAEIEPQHWIAPALNSGNTFLEPMQGAQLKMMGVVKPWAPPRSYGLVIRLTEQGLVRYSLHSRFDGKHHGVVAAVECGGDLFVLAKGCGKILRLSVAGAERSLQT